jgi:hypothetical protein
VDREVEGSEFKAVVDRISSNFKTARAIWGCLWQQRSCTKAVLSSCCYFCIYIEMDIFEHIPVHWIHGGSPKAASSNFSCIYMPISISKGFRYFSMHYCPLTVKQPTPHFFSTVVLQKFHE